MPPAIDRPGLWSPANFFFPAIVVFVNTQHLLKMEPARYTWRSTCRTFVYVTSVTWQAFTRRNYCVTHDCVTSMCVKYIWMTKVSKSWRNKTMTHINKTRITLTWRHKYINSTHVIFRKKGKSTLCVKIFDIGNPTLGLVLLSSLLKGHDSLAVGSNR